MPSRPKRPHVSSGYARLAQADEEEEEDPHYSDEDDISSARPARVLSATDPRYEPLQPGRRSRPSVPTDVASAGKQTPRTYGRRRASSGVDIKAINARLEKWADEIASKFKLRKIKGKSHEEEKLEIHHSVFQAPDWVRPATAEILAARFLDRPDEKMTKLQFDDVVESVRVAIELGTNPTLISQGSSGSYFARNSDGKVVGVFKPKDEEPYASKNPKWTKWIHRNLFPFFFGRACLIPNLSYVSEAAAYVLDTRLQTNLVPYTDIVYLSSISFNYDYWVRRAYYKRKKHLPQKIGSFQVFLKGFQDANIFLKKHPWPDQQNAHLEAPSTNKGKKRRKRRWAEECRPSRSSSPEDDELYAEDGETRESRRRVFWTDALQQSFREELEKLVILDYIMRNTDRGLDNWMIKIDEVTQTATIVAEPTVKENGNPPQASPPLDPYPREEDMALNGKTARNAEAPVPQAAVGAIDNSLSWPWKHPDAWRSFPFGWLFLPVSLIGQPFSEKTRQHFLPLLTSKQWWSDTQVALRHCFTHDSDFKERMFARQMAVMKGQAWNVVETLKMEDHGPLELTRRTRVCVWDDLVDVPVVVPMRTPSPEAQRRRQSQGHPPPVQEDMQEEMDIGAIRTSPPPPAPNQPIIAFSPPSGDANRFNRSRETSPNEDTRPTSDYGSLSSSPVRGTIRVETRDPADAGGPPDGAEPQPQNQSTTQAARPPTGRSSTSPRMSFDETSRRRKMLQSSSKDRKRNFSFSLSARRLSDGIPGRSSLDDDLNAGDLGFAAAREMEGMRKKVIVERLETVKSRNPVFTWC